MYVTLRRVRKSDSRMVIVELIFSTYRDLRCIFCFNKAVTTCTYLSLKKQTHRHVINLYTTFTYAIYKYIYI